MISDDPVESRSSIQGVRWYQNRGTAIDETVAIEIMQQKIKQANDKVYRRAS